MNKIEFCAKMAERTGMSKAECQRQYDNVIGNLYDFLSEGEDVNIYGLANFEVVTKDESQARNPSTGEAITVPAHKVLKVKLSKSIKDAVKALPFD